MNLTTKRILCVTVLIGVSAFAAFAQMTDASTMLTTTHTTLKGLVATLLNIVTVILGLVGAAMLVTAFSKYGKGDPSSADSLMRVGSGLLIAVIILQVIRAVFLK